MKVFNTALLGLLLFLALGALYSNMQPPCDEPLRYAVGSFDSRFGLTEKEFVKVLADAESVWEAEAGRDLFAYDPQATFKVNLVYDDRQARTEEYGRIRNNLERSEGQFKTIEEEYESLLSEYDTKRVAYDKSFAQFEVDLAEYNREVDYWNSRGGAPEKEYADLKKEQEGLDRRAEMLEDARKELNSMSRRINIIAEQGNDLAENYNHTVSTYNTRFGTTTQFDQGDYRGTEINIYQFNALSDLRMVAVHEFGHALGIDHVDDSKSVMYYFMGDQNLNKIELTGDDRMALYSACKIEK